MNKFIVLRAAALSAALVLAAAPALPQQPAIDRALAKQYFAEAKSISDKDTGASVTVPLCGPLLNAAFSLTEMDLSAAKYCLARARSILRRSKVHLGQRQRRVVDRDGLCFGE